MDTIKFVKVIEQLDVGFYTGVPDSNLAPFCNYLMQTYGISHKHIIAANEGNCVALAAGHYLATGKIPVVYLQNSGIGNLTNPIASLLDKEVYGIPCIFIIGWRGEPEIKDEPQHVFQGQITTQLLDLMNIYSVIISNTTTIKEIEEMLAKLKEIINSGKSIAFIIKKGALTSELRMNYSNEFLMKREEIIRRIVTFTNEDIVVSTTGKVSRELFEIREKNNQEHKYDFLTVGSMGHCSSIALSIALEKSNSKVWCIDGDGALLMHMGAMAVIGAKAPRNMIHIVINNGAHETVGGMPTVANKINLVQIALGCGYPRAYSVENYKELDNVLNKAANTDELMLVEIKAALGAREDLGRPTSSAKENKEVFMKYLSEVQ